MPQKLNESACGSSSFARESVLEQFVVNNMIKGEGSGSKILNDISTFRK